MKNESGLHEKEMKKVNEEEKKRQSKKEEEMKFQIGDEAEVKRSNGAWVRCVVTKVQDEVYRVEYAGSYKLIRFDVADERLRKAQVTPLKKGLIKKSSNRSWRVKEMFIFKHYCLMKDLNGSNIKRIQLGNVISLKKIGITDFSIQVPVNKNYEEEVKFRAKSLIDRNQWVNVFRSRIETRRVITKLMPEKWTPGAKRADLTRRFTDIYGNCTFTSTVDKAREGKIETSTNKFYVKAIEEELDRYATKIQSWRYLKVTIKKDIISPESLRQEMLDNMHCGSPGALAFAGAPIKKGLIKKFSNRSWILKQAWVTNSFLLLQNCNLSDFKLLDLDNIVQIWITNITDFGIKLKCNPNPNVEAKVKYIHYNYIKFRTTSLTDRNEWMDLIGKHLMMKRSGPALTRALLFMDQPLGFSFEGNRIADFEDGGQAEFMLLDEGWSFYSIDGVKIVVDDTKVIEHHLEQAKKKGRELDVVFNTSPDTEEPILEGVLEKKLNVCWIDKKYYLFEKYFYSQNISGKNRTDVKIDDIKEIIELGDNEFVLNIILNEDILVAMKLRAKTRIIKEAWMSSFRALMIPIKIQNFIDLYPYETFNIRWWYKSNEINVVRFTWNVMENMVSKDLIAPIADYCRLNTNFNSAVRDIIGERNCFGPLKKIISLNEQDVYAIGEFIKANSKLTHLYLPNQDIGSEAAISIAYGIKTNNTITELNLSRNKICDKAAKPLSEAFVKNTTLRNVSLLQNKISNHGVKIIDDAIHSQQALKVVF